MLQARIRRPVPPSVGILKYSHRTSLQQWHIRPCSSCIPSPTPQTPKATSISTPSIQAADHRTLGMQQKLFITSIYSPGSPIFLPAGTLLFNRLVAFLRRQYVHYGFEEVLTPTMYKKELWKRSGHLENYGEDMFTVTSLSPARSEKGPAATDGEEGGETEPVSITEQVEEEAEYGLKPMNCPGHCLIFASVARSYRELPIRYADFSGLHRNEVSGALSGLSRVRRFHQDDGHIFCRPSQVEDEIKATLEFVRVAYKALRLGPFRLVLSTRPQDHFIGTIEEWDRAEKALANALDHATSDGGGGTTGTTGKWELNPGDGAFYGPKIDVILKDQNGKEHQTATIQLDFQLPKRFGLTYSTTTTTTTGVVTTGGDDNKTSNPSNDDKRDIENESEVEGGTPVMIHRAVLGSVERLLALLIERTDGSWPLWLNPKQVLVVTVNNSAEVMGWANEVRRVLLGLPSPSPSPSPSSDNTAEAEGGGGGEGLLTLARAIRPSEATGLVVDLDDSAESVGFKVGRGKRKGYGVVVVVGKRDVKKKMVMVDATGIPEVEGQDRDGWEKMEMKPVDLLRFVVERVDRYE